MRMRWLLTVGMLLLVLLNLGDILYHNTTKLEFLDLRLYWEEFRVTILGYDTGYYYHMGYKSLQQENFRRYQSSNGEGYWVI